MSTERRIDDHCPTEVSLPCKSPDLTRNLVNVLGGREIKAIEFRWQQQELSGYIVAESLDRRIRGSAADSGLAEKQVHELMQERERPCGLGIAIIDDNQRSHLIRDDESSVNLDIDGGMVAAQVTLE